MRRAFLLAIPVFMFLVSAWSGSALEAQDNTPTRGRSVGLPAGTLIVVDGVVTAVTVDSVTVKVGAADMKFSVDAKTVRNGVKVGQAVQVSYFDQGANHRTTRIRATSSAGSGGGSVAAVPDHGGNDHIRGVVTNISAQSVTVQTDVKTSKTLTLTDKTTFNKGGKAAHLSDLRSVTASSSMCPIRPPKPC